LLFAKHLSEKKYFEEAGLILFRANLLEDSLDLFLKAGKWDMFSNACLKLSKKSFDLTGKLKLILGNYFRLIFQILILKL
jgi:hypothetical protein